MLRSYNPERAALRAAKAAAERQRRKDACLAALMATISRRSSKWSADTPTTPAPKTEPQRNPALLEMARGRPCLLLAVHNCRSLSCDSSTTVACHRNEGKGMSTKVSDAYTCWGCAACHEWYDRSSAARAEKRRMFMAAHLRQVEAWRVIATDRAEPERFRRAALWALERLNATPIVDLENAP